MQGMMRVIPSEASSKAHRLMMLRQAPTQSLLEDIVGDSLSVIEEFDTILYKGHSFKALAFRARRGGDLSPNTHASWLRIQSQVRKHGFSGTRPMHEGPGILGTTVILFGDRPFFQAAAWSILLSNTNSLAISNQEG